MQALSLRVELLKPTERKKEMYAKMTETNTKLANWLLNYQDLNNATTKVFSLYSEEKFPSAITNQTIREVKSKKKSQKAKKFKKFWCTFNNQNNNIEKEGNLYKVSFPTLDKRIGVPLVVRDFQKKWLDKILDNSVKKGSIMLHEKRGRWFVTISISFEKSEMKSPEKLWVLMLVLGI